MRWNHHRFKWLDLTLATKQHVACISHDNPRELRDPISVHTTCKNICRNHGHSRISVLDDGRNTTWFKKEPVHRGKSPIASDASLTLRRKVMTHFYFISLDCEKAFDKGPTFKVIQENYESQRYSPSPPFHLNRGTVPRYTKGNNDPCHSKNLPRDQFSRTSTRSWHIILYKKCLNCQ